MFPLVKRLWKHIALRRKRQCILLFGLTVLASLSEIISIGAIFPFLGALLNPEKIYQNQYALPLIQWLNIKSSSELLLPLSITFGVAAILAGGIRLLLIWATTKLSFAMGADLGCDIYRSTLHQEYKVHINRNTSEVIDAIQNKTNAVIYSILIPSLNLMSSFVMMALTLVALLLLSPFITITTLVCFGSVYLYVIWFARKKLVDNGLKISTKSIQILKTLQEGLGAIREVLLDANQSFYLKIFQSADLELRQAQASSTYIGSFPRYFVETLGMVALAGFALYLSSSDFVIGAAIPILGVAALGAQKLLPFLQQAYSAWANLKVGRASLLDVLFFLEDNRISLVQDGGIVAPLEFREKIEMKDIFFKYESDNQWVLYGVNIEIKKGSRVGFIGQTGGGKSTFLDIFMGLLDPSSGVTRVDGNEVTSKNKIGWQKLIAHVPQVIYLSDGTIAENIAFGILPHEINYERILEVVVQAQLLPFISGLSDGVLTHVGERGVKLSGGQRQRIGIARALYKRANILIFDEATSSLDNETESAVMEAIWSLSTDLTILIIAHRMSTLDKCDEIYELTNKNLVLKN